MTAGKAASSNGTAPQRVIDLASARAARAEAQRQPVTLKWSEDISFTLPVELPADFALYAQEGLMRESVKALVGDQAGEFFALHPSMDDINELVEAAGRVYGVKPGE